VTRAVHRRRRRERSPRWASIANWPRLPAAFALHAGHASVKV
jgi:hypothetical protein